MAVGAAGVVAIILSVAILYAYDVDGPTEAAANDLAPAFESGSTFV